MTWALRHPDRPPRGYKTSGLFSSSTYSYTKRQMSPWTTRANAGMPTILSASGGILGPALLLNLMGDQSSRNCSRSLHMTLLNFKRHSTYCIILQYKSKGTQRTYHEIVKSSTISSVYLFRIEHRTMNIFNSKYILNLPHEGDSTRGSKEIYHGRSIKNH